MAAHLPPTPPPSPPRRRHKKKHDDPFLDMNTPLPSPDISFTNPTEEDSGESLITRILLNPLLFTSFLISLFLVNLSDRLRRTRARPRSRTPSSKYAIILRYIYPSSWLDLDPEPYQDPSTSTWNRDHPDGSHVEPHSVLNPCGLLQSGGTTQKDDAAKDGPADEKWKNERGKGKKKGKKPWYLRKKIRKVAKLEMEDAFEMRGRIIVGMLVLAAAFLIGVFMGVRWTMRWMWYTMV